MSDSTIKGKETDLLKAKKRIIDEVDEAIIQLKSLPDINDVKKEADNIRRMLMEQYGGQERLSEMSFDDKRALLHWLFGGKDHEGTPYGIYVSVVGRGKKQAVNYFIYGRIVGLRTLKEDDINYMGYFEEELKKENNNYKTNISTLRKRK